MDTTSDITASRPATALTLRNVLLLDAGVSGANGLAYLAGAAVLDSLLGPASAVLVGLGVFLLAYGAALAWIGTRRPVSRPATMLVVDANVLWVAASVGAVSFGWLELTTTGTVWALLQAAVVAGFAGLQVTALRRSRREI